MILAQNLSLGWSQSVSWGSDVWRPNGCWKISFHALMVAITQSSLAIGWRSRVPTIGLSTGLTFLFTKQELPHSEWSKRERPIKVEPAVCFITRTWQWHTIISFVSLLITKTNTSTMWKIIKLRGHLPQKFTKNSFWWHNYFLCRY